MTEVRQDFTERLAATHFEADGAIPREIAGAGEHEVAHPGEARDAEHVPALGDGESGVLPEAACDPRGAGVVSEPEPVAGAGRDREHVLERAADLDAGRVVARIHAEPLRRERALHLHRQCFVLRGDHDVGREPERDFLRKARAGQHSEPLGRLRAEHVGDHLAHQHERVVLDPLRRTDEGRVAVDERGCGRERVAECVRRHDEDDEFCPTERLRKRAGRPHGIGQLHAGEIPDVFAGPVDRERLILAAGPEAYTMTLVAEGFGECRTPGPCTDDRYLFHVEAGEPFFLGGPSVNGE